MFFFAGQEIAGGDQAAKSFLRVDAVLESGAEGIGGKGPERLTGKPVTALAEEVVTHPSVLRQVIGQGQMVKAQDFAKVRLAGSLGPVRQSVVP